MKTVNLNSVTISKNGIPVELMGVTDKEIEWELIANVTVEEDVANIEIPIDTSKKYKHLNYTFESPTGTAIGTAFSVVTAYHKKYDASGEPSAAENVQYYNGSKRWLFGEINICENYYWGWAKQDLYQSYSHTNAMMTTQPLRYPWSINDIYKPSKTSVFYKFKYDGAIPSGTKIVIYAR